MNTKSNASNLLYARTVINLTDKALFNSFFKEFTDRGIFTLVISTSLVNQGQEPVELNGEDMISLGDTNIINLVVTSKFYKLNLMAQIKSVAHVLVHVRNKMFGIDDEYEGFGHNKLFKESAKDFGLEVEDVTGKVAINQREVEKIKAVDWSVLKEWQE